jgi:hypothetical protein
MLSFLLFVALVGLQAATSQEPDSWPWDTVFEWEVNCWEWPGEEGDKVNPIPKDARKVATLKLYESFGRRAYARADFGKEATIGVALSPKDVDRQLGLMTTVNVAVLRPNPQPGGEKASRMRGAISVYTKGIKFGDQRGFAGTGFPVVEKNRAGDKTWTWVAFSLTIRKCEQDKKKLIEDYFEDDRPPKARE